jgi:hypothetical protein
MQRKFNQLPIIAITLLNSSDAKDIQFIHISSIESNTKPLEFSRQFWKFLKPKELMKYKRKEQAQSLENS